MTTPWTVYLMRHGEAAWTSPDSERSLTLRGIDQTRFVLEAMGERGACIRRILSSPFRRAKQTAAEAEAITGLTASRYDCLTPDEPADRTLQELESSMADGTLIVAHQPLLGNLVSLLTTGGLREPYPFTTSEVVQLEVELWAPNSARFICAFQP